MATNYRVYGSAGQRHRYRFFALHVTALLLVVAVLSHVLPGPWVRGLYTAYFTWSPYHYSGQNYGIALMYARRGGVDVGPGEKRALYLACLASFLTYLVVINTAMGSPDPRLLQLGIPLDVGRPLFVVLLAAGLLCAGAFAWRVGRRASGRVLLPVLLLVAAQFTWFSGLSAGVFFARELSLDWFDVQALLPALAFLHCAQYLGVTTYYAKREQAGEGTPFRAGRYFLVLVVGGLLLWPGTTRLFSLVFTVDYGLSFLVMASVINIHHFILDGAIWKLRDGRIARLLIATGDRPEPPPVQAGTPVGGRRRALALAAVAVVAFSLGTSDIASQLLVARGGGFARAGRWEDAGWAYATALRMNGSLAGALDGLALSEMHRRRMPAALERWRESVRLNPLSTHARTGLGETYLKLGRLTTRWASWRRRGASRPTTPRRSSSSPWCTRREARRRRHARCGRAWRPSAGAERRGRATERRAGPLVSLAGDGRHVAVDVAELKNRLSHYLRLVRRGEPILVSDRDPVIARLEPAGGPEVEAGDEAARLAALEAKGIVRRRSGRITRDLFATRPRVDVHVVASRGRSPPSR
jgi:antitoxin (DNA-binding transcriptional repressor) of toxin-antitoxin stability system